VEEVAERGDRPLDEVVREGESVVGCGCRGFQAKFAALRCNSQGTPMARSNVAERYRELGFRVIEGGKSRDLVILTTAAIAELYDKEHFHVTRDLADYRKSMAPNLEGSFNKHCVPTTYEDSRNRTQDCFGLTKVGFLAFAPKYDSSLGFLLALAFDALENDEDGDIIVQQINQRIRELRSGASGQSELAFDRPTPAPAEPAPSEHKDFWIDNQDGLAIRISRTYDEAGTLSGFYCIGPDGRRPFESYVQPPNGAKSQVFVRITRDVPFEVVERNFMRCGSGPYMPIAIASLRHWLAL
jgi:Phage regulatory protein Rha (Phage_pRha)